MGMKECEYVGIDYKEIQKLKKQLNKCGKMASALGVTVFGGSGCGSIRAIDSDNRVLILDELAYDVWDGGDGSTRTTYDGLCIGECEW